jgi:hypothetical protein
MQLISIPVVFAVASFMPHVDWLGHLGGGIIFGDKAIPSRQKLFRLGGVALVALLVVIPLFVINLTGKRNCD